jgi:septation ring formation regulator EzrA
MLPTSDMFKKIKSIFIVEDPAAEQAAKAVESSSADTSNTPSAPASGGQSSAPQGGTPDPKFTELLLKAIETNNTDGFDYLEYMNSIRSLENVIPDEIMRYKSAFEMAKTMGVTKEKLAQSGEHYLKVLANEEKKFRDAMENQKARQIQARADQMASMEKAIADKQAQIEKLTREIEEAKTLLGTTKSEIEQAMAKIESTNQQFVSSYNHVFGRISDDMAKIKSNL